MVATLWMPLNAFAEKTVTLTLQVGENTQTAKLLQKMLEKRLSALSDVVVTKEYDKSDMDLNIVVLEQKTGGFTYSYIVAYSAYKLCKYNYVGGVFAPTLEQLVDMTVENIKEHNLKPFREGKFHKGDDEKNEEK
jgi:hypothetical protein